MNVREATIDSENISAINKMTNEKARRILEEYGRPSEYEIDGSGSYGFNQRGIAYTKLGMYEKAIEEFTNAISRILKGKTDQPAILATYYSNRGYIYLLSKKFDKCIADCAHSNELYQSDPTFATSGRNKKNVIQNHLYMSKAYGNKSKLDSAINHIEIVLSISLMPSIIEQVKKITKKHISNMEFILNANCSTMLRAIIQENLISEANEIQSQDPVRAEVIRFYLKLSIENVTVNSPNLENILLSEVAVQKLSDEAIKLIRADIEKLNRKRADEQVTHYTNEFASCENDYQIAQTYNARGLAYGRLQLFKRAITDFSEAIPLIEESYKLAKSMVYFNRGLAFASNGEFDKSIVDYSEAIRWGSDFDCLLDYFATIYIARAYAYIKELNFNDAIDDINKASLIYPSSSNLKPLVAEIYSVFFLQALGYILRDDCSDKLRELVHECLIKSSRAYDPNDFSFDGHVKLCNFYLKLLHERKCIEKKDSVDLVDKVVLSQARMQELHPVAMRLLENEVNKYREFRKSLFEKRCNAVPLADRAPLLGVTSLEETKNENPDEEITIDFDDSGQITDQNAHEIINDYTAMLSHCESDNEKARVLQIRALAYKRIRQYQNALQDTSAMLLLISNKNQAIEYCSRAHIYMCMFDFAKAVEDIIISLSLAPPGEYCKTVINILFDIYFLQTCEFILRVDCPDALREIIQEKLSKSLFESLTKEPTSSHAEICKLYLSLVMKRDSLFNNGLSFLTIKIREAKKLNLSQDAILEISNPRLNDRIRAEKLSKTPSDSTMVNKFESKPANLFSFYKSLPENKSTPSGGDTSLSAVQINFNPIGMGRVLS